MGPNPKRPAPGPRGLPLAGSLPDLVRDPLGAIHAYARDHGDVVRVRIGPRVSHLVCSPEGMRHVLVDAAARYAKGRTFEKTRDYLGNGLAVSEGELWRRQRRLVQPQFQKERLRGLVPIMARTIARAIERWRPHAERGEPLDIAAELTRLTLDVVAHTLFGTAVDEQLAELGGAFKVALEHTSQRVLWPVDLPRWLPTPANLRFRRALATIDRLVLGVIEARRRSEEPAADLLAMLLAARDPETGESMSDAQLRDEVVTFFLGGTETTANALAWAFYLLAQNPDAEKTLRGEIALVLGGRDPTADDLARLSYAAQVFEEALRLYPQNWVMSRDAVQGDEIGGYPIPAGTTVFLGVHRVHRDPRLWDEPDAFRPERFASDAPERPPFAYLPFGGGQRKCIGSHFAMMEAVLAIALIARAYRVELVPGHPVVPDPKFSLKPKHGVLVRLTRP